MYWRGSSPLTRGKREIGKSKPRDPRLIPAHAGKTRAQALSWRPQWAHPRSRGENQPRGRDRTARCGSSPLTRGKPAIGLERIGRARLIPAHAGKTGQALVDPRAPWAHPRSRGENVKAEQKEEDMQGSSPLTRGKLLIEYRLRTRPRLIPAHAGKTYPETRRCRTTWAHPRSRGENSSRPR